MSVHHSHKNIAIQAILPKMRNIGIESPRQVSRVFKVCTMEQSEKKEYHGKRFLRHKNSTSFDVNKAIRGGKV